MALITNAQANCDWKSIKKIGQNYSYSKECHIEVGKTINRVRNLEIANLERKQESDKLLESLELKDLALDKADQRIMNWRAEAYNQNERLQKQNKYSNINKYIYFGSGVILTTLSVWLAGQVVR